MARPTLPADGTNPYGDVLRAAINDISDRADAFAPVGRTVTAATTIVTTDQVILFNSATAISQVLPAANAVAAYKLFQLTNTGLGVVTLTTAVSGIANRVLNQYATLNLFTDGTSWFTSVIGDLSKLTVTTTDPGISFGASTGYSVGDRWLNTNNREYWVCASNTTGAAIWKCLNGDISATEVVTGTTYTLVLVDLGKVKEFNNAAAITVTVPTNATAPIPVGGVIELCQAGSGPVSVIPAPSSSVVIRSLGTAVTAGQWATIQLRKRAQDEWLLSGATTA